LAGLLFYTGKDKLTKKQMIICKNTVQNMQKQAKIQGKSADIAS